MKLSELYKDKKIGPKELAELKELRQKARNEPDIYAFIEQNMNERYTSGSGARELAQIWKSVHP